MGQIGAAAGMGTAMGAIQGWMVGGPVGMIVGAVLGGVLCGVSAALDHPPSAPKKPIDEIYSTAVRDAPVPIVFGRARLAGNFIALGTFWRTGDNLGKATPGRKIYHLNAVLGLCEGPIQTGGNFYQDRQNREDLRKVEKQSIGAYRLDLILGTATEGLPALVADSTSGYSETPLIPWRNLAKVAMRTIVGDTPRLTDINVDVVGPDLTLSLDHTTTDANAGDAAVYACYDAFSECWYSPISRSSVEARPWGIVQQGRGLHPRRYHTPPPAAVTASIAKGWYLGRHDVLVMQDPGDYNSFWIGYWGIAPDSADWQKHSPDPEQGYVNPILLHHLDELHGILHTLHSDGSTYYFMRWTLLTGRVQRVNIALAHTPLAMLYSPDADAYLVATASGLCFYDPRSGLLDLTFATTWTTDCIGLCVSGQLVGMVSASRGLLYFDRLTGATLGPYGSTSAALTAGALGCSAMAQNTWTNHVTLVKQSGGAAAYVNFLPSVVETAEDLDACGTPQGAKTPNTEFQTFPAADPVAGWVRDWSWRSYNHIFLKQLQGTSSLAAALWNVVFDAPQHDSARWGAGLNPVLGNISSFESVHGFCVGGAIQVMPRTDKGKSRCFYGERAKFDLGLTSQVAVSSLLSNMLAAINGYRRVVDGKLQVGILRRGMLPVWHWTEDQMEEGKGQLVFIGRADGANRVKLNWTYIRDEYRQDIAEANDEYDQSVKGRVIEQMLGVPGIGRKGHADWLCQHILDYLVATRRQASFQTHFLAYLLVPGDPVEVTHAGWGLDRMPAIVSEIHEQQGQSIQVNVIEHPRLREAPRLGSRSRAVVQSVPATPRTGEGSVQEAPVDSDADSIFWFSRGVSFAPGTYTLEYVAGCYSPTAQDGSDCTVAGYDIVGVSGGSVVVLATAPGLTHVGGWATQDLAEAANAGQQKSLTLSYATPLGLRIHTGHAYGAAGSSAAPIYRVTWSSGYLLGNGVVPPPPPPFVPPPGGGEFWVNVALKWINLADANGQCTNPAVALYVANDTDGGVCYGAATLAGGLAIQSDVYLTNIPGGTLRTFITGTFTGSHNFRVWFNQVNTLAPLSPPTLMEFAVTNTRTTPIVVNGEIVQPNQTWTLYGFADAGYGAGDTHLSGGGTAIQVST